jgi:phosphopantetheinyl transferase
MRLSGPLDVLRGCRLWLAMFDREPDDSLSKQERELSRAQMSHSDLQRWHRFRPLEKKRQFLNSRLAVHSILQKEFRHSADHVSFDTGPQGQPMLLSAQVKELPQISLSHSGTVVAVAVSQSGIPVGVDIERVEPLRMDALRLIAAHPHDLAWDGQQGGLSETEFLSTQWTIKESVWKSLGGVGEMKVSEISVVEDRGVMVPRVIHPFFADDVFRTRLFAVQCEEVFPDTMLVDPSAAGLITLRGSVSQRIPAAGHGLWEGFPGNSLTSTVPCSHSGSHSPFCQSPVCKEFIL